MTSETAIRTDETDVTTSAPCGCGCGPATADTPPTAEPTAKPNEPCACGCECCQEGATA